MAGIPKLEKDTGSRMIGIDTNVLLRLFTEDNPDQKAASTAALRGRPSESVRVTTIVLAELVWTLRRFYKIPKLEIISIVERLLAREELVIEGRAEALEALGNYQYGKADFGDYFIASLNRSEGASPTLTFDRDAASDNDLFQLLA
jgi:predicted nucleic-acid-binding protein